LEPVLGLSAMLSTLAVEVSHNGELHVLAAVPSAWPSGQVQGARGRGGYTLGANWGRRPAGRGHGRTIVVVAEGDVIEIEQDFVGALPVPDLVAGVARVGQDHPDGVLGPGEPGPVRVAFAGPHEF
jgi:alpha-L-fucosidase 2